MLARKEIAAVWQLQVATAIACQIGNPGPAASIMEIADAAERESLRRGKRACPYWRLATVAPAAVSRPIGSKVTSSKTPYSATYWIARAQKTSSRHNRRTADANSIRLFPTNAISERLFAATPEPMATAVSISMNAAVKYSRDSVS